MLKVVKTRRILVVLKKLGFQKTRQSGSHLFFRHVDSRTTTVPKHDEIRIKLLTKIIKDDLKMKKKDFMDLL